MIGRVGLQLRSQWIAIAIACIALAVALLGNFAFTSGSSDKPTETHIAVTDGTIDLRDFKPANKVGSGATPGHEMVADSVRPRSIYNKWAWFKNTYWVVPEQGIYSVLHNQKQPGQFTVIRGQTVFHITDYFNGFWVGAVKVSLTTQLVASCQYVLGEVTPEGEVYLTMFSASDGAVTNTPVGQMVKKNGHWTMVNQMTGPAQGGTLSHWAYMIQSVKGDAYYKNLPFANESIPNFMSGCPEGPTFR